MKKLVFTTTLALTIAVAVTVLMGSAAAAVPAPPTLWITDDVEKLTYNVDLNGVVITSFETPNTAYSSVAVDPIDGTLWGANEGSSSGTPPGKLVNYDRTGGFIKEIEADAFGAVGTEGLALAIAADDDSLWVVDDPAQLRIGSAHGLQRLPGGQARIFISDHRCRRGRKKPAGYRLRQIHLNAVDHG